jgi:hypothetical protein
MPDAERLHRGSKLAGRAAVYTHRLRSRFMRSTLGLLRNLLRLLKGVRSWLFQSLSVRCTFRLERALCLAPWSSTG